MTGWLVAASVLFGVSDLALLSIGLGRRSVLPALCAGGALALVFMALASGLAGATGEALLLISVITSMIGTVVLWLGDAVGRLLDEASEPEKGI
ncbi:MAG: hypothetical protein M3022_14600 [Actinomycetota bacterium]|nr:hypothetical protein [Actinomycetota bacterium]